MGQPFIGEIRLFAGNFPPSGWALCQGQLQPISENDALFTLIGTTYGGDGQETFALPDLQGRVPVHQGTGGDGIAYVMGEKAGVESVTLSTQQMPVHNHPFLASTDGGISGPPTNSVLANEVSVTPYRPNLAPTIPMAAAMVQPAGGSQPHSNLQPLACLNYIISLYGIFPTQN